MEASIFFPGSFAELDDTADASFKPDDIIIALIGQTGTGKSSFANKVVGAERTEVGHSLKSCTSAIRILRHSSSPPNPDFVLIDTPGFNDTSLSDIQVLETITDWLSDTYKKDVILSGVLYFHRISDIRLTSTERQNIAIFESLVGMVALENVIIVSTMWDEIKEEEAEAKEKALKGDAWKYMTSKGARVARHRNTRGSALDIVWMLQGARNHQALLVQEEMVDHGRPLPQTTVGQKVATVWSLVQKVASQVISGLEKKASNGWTEEIVKEIAKQEKIKSDVNQLQERWFLNMMPLRQWFGLGTIQESRPGPPSHIPYRTPTLNSRLTRAKVPSLISYQASTTSTHSPMTPIYGVPIIQSIHAQAMTCLKAALAYTPAIPIDQLTELIDVSYVIVKELQEIWPQESLFERSILHMTWFVLSVVNHVGERDLVGDRAQGFSGQTDSKRTLDDAFAEDSHKKIEFLTKTLAEHLITVKGMLSDVRTLSSRRREKKKKKISDWLVCQPHISVVCSNLAVYTSKDPLRLSIFTIDPCVSRTHQSITQSISPVADHGAAVRLSQGQQHLLESMVGVQTEVGGLRRLVEQLYSSRSQPSAENHQTLITGGNITSVTNNEFHVTMPQRRKTFSNSLRRNSKRQNTGSTLSVDSTSTISTSGSSPPSQ